MRIDLNADVGEGGASDLALLECVTSINIACGWHAGDALQMQSLVRAALPRGLAIGAHPGYPDREHFGRRELQLPPDEVRAGLLYQLGALDAIVRAEGGVLSHVKPHGALYNQAAREPGLARCIARAVRDHDPALPVVALAGSAMVEVLRAEGLAVLQEGFADRGYAPDGQLAPRGTPGALLADASAALAQVLAIVKSRTVVATDGSRCRVQADTICLHGDGPHALEFARVLRQGLAAAGVAVQRPG